VPGMLTWFRSNAAWLAGVLTAVVGLATAFGLQLTGEQVGAITALVAAVTGGAVHLDARTGNGK
jgi:hypothetical protein